MTLDVCEVCGLYCDVVCARCCAVVFCLVVFVCACVCLFKSVCVVGCALSCDVVKCCMLCVWMLFKMCLCGLFVVSRVLLYGVRGFVMLCLVYVWRVCAWLN